ncbi:YheC/YheD family protein [Metabacillus litoralis]|uniref:YheC/YheD family endospore coat-associated protein n=1 Tax=Metabacillus litoralis TaxID=152268 RepID=UPI00203D0B72|nr:YheC/YheD family protein [Metabacillus litoralis]MCM3411341.1 YheC/YheD family protein [Metabacillus litoralis]
MHKVTLGFLAVHLNHENGYATEIAKRSASFNIECVRFEPTSIDPSTLTINGEKYDSITQTWKIASFSIPTFIYDRCFYNNQQASKKSKPIVDWLKKNPSTTFLGFGLPDKWQIYSNLIDSEPINSYLPETEKLTTSAQIIKHIRTNSSCMLKPISGSRGNGIIAVRQTSNDVNITYHKGHDKKTKSFQSLQLFSDWCDRLIKQQSYLLQPFLSLTDQEGYPFDIRLLLQKDRNGEWILVEKGVRKGYHGSFLSNLNSGGAPITYEEWSKSLTMKQKFLLEDELSTIITHLPKLLDMKFNRLFEVGIDIGFAQDGSTWILDINSKPGRKTFVETKPHLKDVLYESPLAYCHYLMKQRDNKGAEVNE